MAAITICPSHLSLQSLVDGKLSSQELDPCIGHVEHCEACQIRLEQVALSATVVNNDTLVSLHSDAEPEIVQVLMERLQSLRSSQSRFSNDETLQTHPAQLQENDSYDFLSPAESSDEIGRLGNYRILSVLGQGGMGIVFRAEDVSLKRIVAIKAMLPTLAVSATAKKRFVREAQTAARIKHDHVVSIYQVGEDRGIPYLAMEFLEGESLESYLQARSSLTPAEVLDLGRQITEGMAAAHRVGLIHRDIKPANIWLETHGSSIRVKILDFGLARHSEDQGLTQQGAIIGTPSYMAPEQASGETVDQRADLFSLGVILYQALTGRKPFQGKDAISTLIAIRTETPKPIREIVSGIPESLAKLIHDLLAKDVSDRPASTADVLRRLEGVSFEPTKIPPVAAAPALPPRKQSKRPILIGLALAFGLLALAGVVAFQFSTKDGTLYVEVEDAADVRFKNGKLEIYDEEGVPKYTLEPSEKNKTLPPGKYLVKVVGADGVKLETDTFELENKGKAFIKVKANGPTDVVVKPDPVKPAVPIAISGTGLILTKECSAELPNPGLDPKKEWTVETYVTVSSKSDIILGSDLIYAPNIFSLYVAKRAFGMRVGESVKLGTGVPMDKRVHVAIVRTDVRTYLYVDGKYSAEFESPALAMVPANSADTKLCFGPMSEDRQAIIEGVRISQTARYKADFTPPGRHETDQFTIALYHCDEGNGDKLTDSSGNGHQAKITNAKWVKSDRTTAPVATPSGGYALRTASAGGPLGQSGVTIPTLKLPARGPYTVETYFTPMEKKNGRLFWIAYQLNLEIGADAKLNIFAKGRTAAGKDNQIPRAEVPFPFIPGKTYHIAAMRTKDESQFQLYVDGKLAASCEAIILGADPFVFGTIAGDFDEIRVSKVARYDNEFTPKSRFETDADTLALYHCDEGQGEILKDSSGNNHHGNIVGTTWVKVDGSVIVPPAKSLPR